MDVTTSLVPKGLEPTSLVRDHLAGTKVVWSLKKHQQLFSGSLLSISKILLFQNPVLNFSGMIPNILYEYANTQQPAKEQELQQNFWLWSRWNVLC